MDLPYGSGAIQEHESISGIASTSSLLSKAAMCSTRAERQKSESDMMTRNIISSSMMMKRDMMTLDRLSDRCDFVMKTELVSALETLNDATRVLAIQVEKIERFGRKVLEVKILSEDFCRLLKNRSNDITRDLVYDIETNIEQLVSMVNGCEGGISTHKTTSDRIMLEITECRMLCTRDLNKVESIMETLKDMYPVYMERMEASLCTSGDNDPYCRPDQPGVDLKDSVAQCLHDTSVLIKNVQGHASCLQSYIRDSDWHLMRQLNSIATLTKKRIDLAVQKIFECKQALEQLDVRSMESQWSLTRLFHAAKQQSQEAERTFRQLEAYGNRGITVDTKLSIAAANICQLSGNADQHERYRQDIESAIEKTHSDEQDVAHARQMLIDKISSLEDFCMADTEILSRISNMTDNGSSWICKIDHFNK